MKQWQFKSKETEKSEEAFYNHVAEEMESGKIDKGLWAKAKVESDGDEKKTESKYILLRVNKLIDEAHENRTRAETLEKEKVSNQNALETLRNSGKSNAFRFKLLSILMFAIGFFMVFISQLPGEDDEFDAEFLVFGVIVMIVGIYSFYQSFVIEKSQNVRFVKNRLNTLFLIMIPFSFVAIALGLFNPIFGLLAFIAFIKMIIDVFKFNSSFNKADKENLI